MKRWLGFILAMAGAAGVLAGCNSGSGNGGVVNVPNCAVPSNTILVYPIPGTKNAPDSTTSVYFASSHTGLDNGNYTSAVQPPNGLPYYLGKVLVKVQAGHVPKPHTTPSFSSPVYYKSFIGGLSAGSTYTIGFNILNQNCTPTGVGSFTTK